jgi:hypothetical protein
MAHTYHHRSQRATKRRKLDRIFREHLSTRRHERNAEAKLMSTFTGLPLAAPNFLEPQDYVQFEMGPGVRISQWDQVGYEADDHAPGCVHVFRRNVFICME